MFDGRRDNGEQLATAGWRLAKIRALLSTLPDDEVAVYEDEIDIRLNPKSGVDWMPRGVRKEVLTPGKKAKAYVAGALDARTRNITRRAGRSAASVAFGGTSFLRTAPSTTLSSASGRIGTAA